MGRPRKQTVDYFPHFVRGDSKTKFILETRWGNDGYAFWFKLLELLGRSDGHCYDCSVPGNKLYLLSLAKVSEEIADEILETLADLGKIDRELWKEHKLIWCQRLVDNLQQVYAKRTVQIPCKPFTEPPQEEKKPEKEIEKQPEEKEKKRGRPAKRKSVLTVSQQALFEKFYAQYPKKVDRATAERAWKKIEPDEEMTDKIVEAVEKAKKYDSRFREKEYTPNPASWLNAKGYLNEYSEGGGQGYGAYENRRNNGAADPGQFKPSGGFRGENV